MVEERNETSVAVPQVSLPALFEEQVARTPCADALVCGELTLSYEELDARVNRWRGC
ncbi:hypothetical protein MMF93_00190 [Streptomyces tubbatahanensis]|uniref:Uncharacterized protein n=1 Tax=Streptomyces tubbatahanensis TaxID=2923272 RepID=A0ABY3XKV3_9ACTN|nr:hypothetical protein [Streptomyces tubbatahanensis]UNS95052.1 hypothetical protein MMF93_00190 [Streptomyces tubbatahanensis]